MFRSYSNILVRQLEEGMNNLVFLQKKNLFLDCR